MSAEEAVAIFSWFPNMETGAEYGLHLKMLPVDILQHSGAYKCAIVVVQVEDRGWMQDYSPPSHHLPGEVFANRNAANC